MKINWGIIGPGKVAGKMAEDLQLSDHAVLYGVASREREKAEAFAERHQAVRCFDSYEALAMAPEIDVIYVATPHTFHYEHTMLCLKHNKAVLCEKPMGIDSGEVKRMIEEAKKRKVFLMEALWTRFIPATEKMLELLDSKAIGDLIFLRADFGFKADAGPEHRIFNKKLGGGALLDIGIYPLYLSLLTLGMPTEIKAMARMTTGGVDSYNAQLLDYENGNKAMLESTFEADTPIEANLYGSKGSIKLHSRFHHSESLTLNQAGKQSEVIKLPYTGHGYYHEIEEVNRCLLAQALESSRLPHGDSLKLIGLIDQIKRQLELQ
ncbi:MAG: Gfo/Idh/MocA family oxidoreductase [Bacteroidetes bacterium]|jgi:predicted dehydrogenase|nr:Gfo/Idh/MocA family oxidoreductase [Bacteroidota bacterium]MBU1577972.1 Gfo/Idh/MocA family oxidoreductase [Bacteroidota bacterium]MBU2466282.1 Gfo/Idh/MocA family oxidoreductase [Bacteroidota bacterium]MDA3942240.1 Gfo/Idh/MocA family oxidoreductase [Bacteroidota bacterium]